MCCGRFAWCGRAQSSSAFARSHRRVWRFGRRAPGGVGGRVVRCRRGPDRRAARCGQRAAGFRGAAVSGRDDEGAVRARRLAAEPAWRVAVAGSWSIGCRSSRTSRADMPPLFIVHTVRRSIVPIENSMALVRALREKGVPVESHFYEKGAHGFGVDPDLGATSEWPVRLERMAGRARFRGRRSRAADDAGPPASKGSARPISATARSSIRSCRAIIPTRRS